MAAQEVLLVTGCAPPEPCGVGDYTARLSAALRRQGVAAELHLVSAAGHLRGLTNRIRREGVHVAHVMYPSRGYARALFPVRIPLAARPARVLLGVHEYAHAHPLRKVIIQIMAARSWRVVVSTELDRRALARYAPAVVPVAANVIPDPAELPAPPLPRERPDPAELAFFGFPRPDKGVENLIEAVALLDRNGCRARITLIGQTPPELGRYRRRLKARIAAAGVAATFTGPLADEAVVAALRCADLCVLPFARGASARHTTLATALQVGVPVVTTLGPDLPAGLRPGEQALLVPPGDAVALATAIEALLADPVHRARLGRAGRDYGAKLTWERLARSFSALYDLSADTPG